MSHIQIDPSALPDVILELSSGVIETVAIYFSEEEAQTHADKWAREHEFKDFEEYRKEIECGDMKDELVWREADSISYN